MERPEVIRTWLFQGNGSRCMHGQEAAVGMGWVGRLVLNICLERLAGARSCLPKQGVQILLEVQAIEGF